VGYSPGGTAGVRLVQKAAAVAGWDHSDNSEFWAFRDGFTYTTSYLPSFPIAFRCRCLPTTRWWWAFFLVAFRGRLV